MIVGTGVDIVEIQRLDGLLRDQGNRFLNRIYTPAEQESCPHLDRRRVAYFAKRYAAKEALVKAFGTGFQGDLSFLDMAVHNDSLGKPFFHLAGTAAAALGTLVPTGWTGRVHLSLSDTDQTAMAFVVIDAVASGGS